MTLYTTSQADVTVKALSRFPARMVAELGLSMSVSNATYTFGFDFTTLSQNTSLAAPSEWWTVVYHDTTGTYERVRVDAIVDYTIEPRRGIGDSDATILSSDRYVELTANLTSHRTWTLPAASSVSGGVHIIVQDANGGISGTNTLTIERDGSDTVNGTTSIVLESAYDGATFYSDGTSKWTYLNRQSSDVDVATGKTLTVDNTVTLSGTDGSAVDFADGGTVAYTGDKLLQFASTASSELASVISDETGTGSLVFANTPTLVTPILGTPTSGTLTNCAGLPVASGISGFGTGIATALAINTGSAGAPVLFNGALGTPSSGTLTNATGLPISTGISGLGTGVATFLATPSSANLKSAITDETGSGGAAVFATGPTITGLNLAAGSTSVAPINFASGTNLTTATAGALEYDGTVFYSTTANNSRGVSPSVYWIALTSTNTLTNSTSIQPLFDGGGGPANGEISLPVGTYYFNTMVYVTSLSGNSHTITFTISAGTATISSCRGAGIVEDDFASIASMTSTAEQVGTIGSTNSSVMFKIDGILRISVAGTIIPKITQATNSAAASVSADSYFMATCLGSNSSAYVGNWS